MIGPSWGELLGGSLVSLWLTVCHFLGDRLPLFLVIGGVLLLIGLLMGLVWLGTTGRQTRTRWRR